MILARLVISLAIVVLLEIAVGALTAWELSVIRNYWIAAIENFYENRGGALVAYYTTGPILDMAETVGSQT